VIIFRRKGKKIITLTTEPLQVLATDEETHGWPKDAEQTITVGAPTHKTPLIMPVTPSHKGSFNTFPKSRLKSKMKHRPPPLVNLLPPVPSSPLPAAIPIHDVDPDPILQKKPSRSSNNSVSSSLRLRNKEKRLSRSSVSSHSSIRSTTSTWSTSLQTPSQTLLVFPSEDVGGSSTVMLTATPAANSFSHLPPPLAPRKKPCLNLGVVSTPTTAFSFVEVKGTSFTPSSLSRQA